MATLQQQLDTEASFLRARWGEPPTPRTGWDRVAEEQRFSVMLEGMPDRLWSTVDCTFFPCTGMFLTKTSWSADEVRSLLGLPHALVGVGSHMHDLELTFVVEIALLDAPPDGGSERWARALMSRHEHLHGADIRTVGRGHQLAE